MSNATFSVKRDEKTGKVDKAFINNAYAYYTKIMNPAPIYEQRKMAKPDKFEYTMDLIVSEDVADEWDEVFGKQTSTKLSKDKFKEIYKIEDDADLPFEAKKYYQIKVKQKAQKADGTPIHKKIRPRVVHKTDEGNIDITFDKFVGNGSLCNVMCTATENDYGAFSYLYRVLVTDLVEYEVENYEGMDEDEEDFMGGDVEYADDPAGNKKQDEETDSEDRNQDDSDEDSDEDEFQSEEDDSGKYE